MIRILVVETFRRPDDTHAAETREPYATGFLSLTAAVDEAGARHDHEVEQAERSASALMVTTAVIVDGRTEHEQTWCRGSEPTGGRLMSLGELMSDGTRRYRAMGGER